MAKPKHTDDYTLYQKLLESTRDEQGIVHRDQAEKLLAESLATDAARASEYAQSRAHEVADGFDSSHKPETEQGMLALGIENYLVIGDNERVQVNRAMAPHTRQWIDVQARNHARVAAAWSTKDLDGRRLLAIQEECHPNCSMWNAEQLRRRGLS